MLRFERSCYVFEYEKRGTKEETNFHFRKKKKILDYRRIFFILSVDGAKLMSLNFSSLFRKTGKNSFS